MKPKSNANRGDTKRRFDLIARVMRIPSIMACRAGLTRVG
jgi:hypothetical protein